MKKVLTAGILAMMFAAPAFAADDAKPAQTAPAPVKMQKQPQQPVSFEQRKADILKNIDNQTARLQKEKECVEAAKTMEDLMKCRELSRPPMPPGMQMNRQGQQPGQGMRPGQGPQSGPLRPQPGMMPPGPDGNMPQPQQPPQ